MIRRTARELAAWPRRRRVVGIVVAAAALLVVAALSGLPPFGAASGAAWRYPLLVVLAAVLGLYAATAVEAPVDAPMTLCDLRWPGLALIGTVYAGRAATVPPALGALFEVGAVALMVWALRERLELEREALRGEGAACVSCRPLLSGRPSRGKRQHEPVVVPLQAVAARSEPDVSDGEPVEREDRRPTSHRRTST